jgi:hypothetical protein
VSRGVCFSSVLEVANQSLAQMPEDWADRRQKIVTENQDVKADEWRVDLYRHFCLKAAESLAKALQSLKHDKFIIAFDECTNIKPRVTTDKLVAGTDPKFLSPAHGISLLALQRMIKAQDSFPIRGFNYWFLFRDTSSTIAEFFHSRNKVSSARHATHTNLPPWPYLGFDMMVESPAATPRSALSYNRLKDYGRPVRLIFPTLFFSNSLRSFHGSIGQPMVPPISYLYPDKSSTHVKGHPILIPIMLTMSLQHFPNDSPSSLRQATLGLYSPRKVSEVICGS